VAAGRLIQRMLPFAYMDESDPDCDRQDVALLPSSSSSEPQIVLRKEQGSFKMTRMGSMRAYWLGCVLCIGGFLFGYDSGIIGRYHDIQSEARG